MGCGPLICGKQNYSYAKEQRLLNKLMSEFSHLSQCYSHDFVINCHKNMLLNPQAFLLKYDKKIQLKQIVPHTILEKWKLILYATNIDNQHYADCIGFDKHFEQQRIASKTYRFSKRNPFEIRLQDLYFHQSYRQIEKDAGRVYLVPQIKQDHFEKLLKKIANHFPESGYSLGVNYIIGYFLLVGMSEMDSFWMFVHLTLNQKFLALGFFQNDLPLTKVIIQIFKNILRRKNKDLYQYIYQQLQADDASWILKWFTSFFFSTFPIQFCHYVLDFVFSFGILGLAIVAFAIVNFFQAHIYKCEQATDFFICLQQLFSFKYFSQQVYIQQFMSAVYEVALHERDFDLLGEIGDNFYVKYFVLYSQWNFKHNNEAREKMNELLSSWYFENKLKRETFTNKMSKSFDGNFYVENKNDTPKIQAKNEPHQSINTNMDAIKNQKIQQKTHEHLPMASDVEQKEEEKISQKDLSNNQKARTIKVSSKHIKFSVKASSFQEQSEPENQDFKTKFPIQKGEIIKRAKSEKALSYRKDLVSKIRSERGFGCMTNQKDKSRKENVTSIKSFVASDNLSGEVVTFNVNPLIQQFSRLNQLSKTLPLRKRSENLGSLNFLEVISGDQGKANNENKMEENLNQVVKQTQNQKFQRQNLSQTPKEEQEKDDELEKIWNENARKKEESLKSQDEIKKNENEMEEFQINENLEKKQSEAEEKQKTPQQVSQSSQNPVKTENSLVQRSAQAHRQCEIGQNRTMSNKIKSQISVKELHGLGQVSIKQIEEGDLQIKVEEVATQSKEAVEDGGEMEATL